jgi:serine/threonine protein kinase
MSIKNVKLIKKKHNLLCISYVEDGTEYFAKVFFVKDDEKLLNDYHRELCINKYIVENTNDFIYHTKLLKIYEDVSPFEYMLDFVDNKNEKCNVMIFEHAGNHTLRYYINKLSSENINKILGQLRDATDILESIDVIHYDLYCESNIMLKKINKKWTIKIVDYGLSYIDETDKSKSDWHVAIESIQHFNKKHRI